MRDTCVWEPIASFGSELEFATFERRLAQEVGVGSVDEVVVATRYATELRERWFVRRGSYEVWRLIAPRGRFTGLWDRVLAA